LVFIFNGLITGIVNIDGLLGQFFKGVLQVIAEAGRRPLCIILIK